MPRSYFGSVVAALSSRSLVTVEPIIKLLLCAQVDLINVKWGHCKNQKRPITWKGVSMVGELLRQSVGSVAAVFSLWDFRLARSSSLSIGRGQPSGGANPVRALCGAGVSFFCLCVHARP